MADELTRPLGLDPPPPKLRRTVAIAIALPLLVGVAGGSYVWLGRDPGAGESAVTAEIAGVAKGEATGSIAAKRGKPRVADPGPIDPSAPVLTELEPAPIELAAAPREDLVEKGRYGLLPRIGEDGTRPLQAYARPIEVAPAMKRVAIVIGGIGIAEEGSAAALDDLPGEVTLAFAPDANGLPRTLAKARQAGHEILLQVPLEPYGYPDVDPGPHTLTTKASAEKNLDSLQWLMSRLTSYVGVVNYMGARFTSEPTAMALLLSEIGKRGLLYLDDGSSPRTEGRVPSPLGPATLRADISSMPTRRRQRSMHVSTSSPPSPKNSAPPSPPARPSRRPSIASPPLPRRPPTGASPSFRSPPSCRLANHEQSARQADRGPALPAVRRHRPLQPRRPRLDRLPLRRRCEGEGEGAVADAARRSRRGRASVRGGAPRALRKTSVRNASLSGRPPAGSPTIFRPSWCRHPGAGATAARSRNGSRSASRGRTARSTSSIRAAASIPRNFQPGAGKSWTACRR